MENFLDIEKEKEYKEKSKRFHSEIRISKIPVQKGENQYERILNWNDSEKS